MATKMKKTEMARLEKMAREDLADTALRHADQLPGSSEWQGALVHLAASLTGAKGLKVAD